MDLQIAYNKMCLVNDFRKNSVDSDNEKKK